MKSSKKVIGFILASVMALSLAGCGGSGTSQTTDSKSTTGTSSTADKGNKSKDGYELALITDVGTIDDKSFNQGSWEGVEAYAKENNIACTYYKPTEKSDEACLSAIDLAVKGGAKLIVCPGYLFEVPIFNAQSKYPDVKFLLIDGKPHNGDYNYDIKENVHSIFYAEEEAGFLAGYAAITEGYKQLGFMGGIAVPAVIRYGYGYIQGADYAAKELGMAKGDIKMKYTYVGNFDASPENMAKAASWYNEGVEVIFSCGGPVGNSVMKAAETAKTTVIGVDVDQYSESKTVITSAVKNLKKSVYDTIDSFYKGTFQGGVSVTLDAASNGIQLPMENSLFKKFNQETYDKLYKQIADGTIEIVKDDAAEDASKIKTDVVTVDLIQ